MFGITVLAAAALLQTPIVLPEAKTGFDPVQDCLVMEKDIKVLGVPEPVCGPDVVKAEWSPDGKYVLAIQLQHELNGYEVLGVTDTPPAGQKQRLVIYSTERKKAVVDMSVASESATNLYETAWIPGESSLLLLYSQEIPSSPTSPQPTQRFLLYRVTLPDGKMRQIDAVDATADTIQAGAGVLLWQSPKQPMSIYCLRQWSQNTKGKSSIQNAYKLVLPGGAIREVRGLPTNVSEPDWDTEGNPVITVYTVAGGKMTKEFFRIQNDGTLTKLSGPFQKYKPAAPTTPFRLRVMESKMANSDVVKAGHPLWLEQVGGAKQSRILVASDVHYNELNSPSDTVLYSSREGVFLRKVLSVDRKVYDALLVQMAKVALMQRAKLCAVAVMMYSADHSDNFPSKSGIIDALSGYLKDPSILNGFVFVDPGVKNMSDLTNPAGTQMGYIQGNGGQAVVYTDGHVKWVPNK